MSAGLPSNLVYITDPGGRMWSLTHNEARGLSRSTVVNGHAWSAWPVVGDES